MSKWFQLYIKVPEGNGYKDNPKAMKRVDETINMFSSFFLSPRPEGIPVQEPDGTWEVRVLQESALSITKRVLIDEYGFEIAREVANEY